MRIRLALIIAVPLLAGCHRAPQTVRELSPLNLNDGFEQPKLSSLWRQNRFEEGAVTMQRKVVRAGRQAIAVTVHPHDKFEAGRDGNLDNERAELLEADDLVSRQDVPYEFRFSEFFPADFPIVPTRLVIAQWKQFCPSETGPCSDQSPVLALRYVNGTMLITQTIEGKRHVLYQQAGEFRNRWLDFRFRVRFTPGPDGHIAAWLGDQPIVDVTGPTATREDIPGGYPPNDYFFFKMGLYRDLMPQPMTVYIDEYSKRQLPTGAF
jgi:Polysaccharide lyase